ncbi:MAG: aquaporin [bacterium]
MDFKKYIAEAIGTFVLVLFGCGVAVVSGVDLVATSLAFGLTIVAMAYSIGNISGCHINPAVSLAMLITKKMSAKDFGMYVLFQCIGSLVASLLLFLLFGSECGFGANAVQGAASLSVLPSVLFGLLAEIVLTFTFILAILGVTSRSENKAVVGIVIGLTLTLVHLLGIGLTGTSVNPARSLFPAIFAGGDSLTQVWIFIVGPFVGSALAALVYNFFLDKDNETKEETN